MDILKAENINFGYGSQKLLKNVNFEMNNEQVIGLFGDSGSGKSTLCKILTGFIKDFDGNVTVNGQKHNDGFNPIQLIYQHPEKVMNPRWKMLEVMEESWMPDDNILNEFGIKKEWFKRYPSELSGGELQRFCIARALGKGTKFILADEITTMLDLITQSQLWSFLIREVQEREIGLLAVSHHMPLLENVCTRLEVLEK
jgi:peptide/nickel transport system ATP-binding protein